MSVPVPQHTPSVPPRSFSPHWNWGLAGCALVAGILLVLITICRDSSDFRFLDHVDSLLLLLLGPYVGVALPAICFRNSIAAWWVLAVALGLVGGLGLLMVNGTPHRPDQYLLPVLIYLVQYAVAGLGLVTSLVLVVLQWASSKQILTGIGGSS